MPKTWRGVTETDELNLCLEDIELGKDISHSSSRRFLKCLLWMT